ncbi:hypothetical protein BD309DRAFT_1024627 [Dichomitus squalens]|nr:hypothetical protein BD309DRAFT_1024627 [Dichomitus squalens]
MAVTPLIVPSAAVHLNAIAGFAPPSGSRFTRFRTGCSNAECPLSAKANVPPSRLAASSSLTRGLTYSGSRDDERERLHSAAMSSQSLLQPHSGLVWAMRGMMRAAISRPNSGMPSTPGTWGSRGLQR